MLVVHALLLAGVDQLRLNETQFIKSHNSYHITTLTMSQVAELSRTAALGLESVAYTPPALLRVLPALGRRAGRAAVHAPQRGSGEIGGVRGVMHVGIEEVKGDNFTSHVRTPRPLQHAAPPTATHALKHSDSSYTLPLVPPCSASNAARSRLRPTPSSA